MAFSFHGSLLTIPQDLREAATVFRLNWWRRFVRSRLPFGIIPLIWNSMMSWAGGWFFLMAAEQFTLGSHSFQLPGLGSYLQTAANDGNVRDLLLGLATLILVIVLLDELLWRPLIAWGSRFKFEQTASGDEPTSPVLVLLQQSALLRQAGRVFVQPVTEGLDRLIARLPAETQTDAGTFGRTTRAGLAGRVAGLTFLAVLLVAGCLGVIATAGLLRHLSPATG